MLHTKYQGSMPCCFKQEDFLIFLPIYAYVKCDPWRGVIFGPRGIMNKLGRGQLGDATYQISRL